jgi:multiple sugar transport system permease protein
MVSLPTRAAAKPAPGGFSAAGRDRAVAWAMVAPSALVILAFSVFPLLYSLTLSFLRWDMQSEDHPFVGLANYAAALTDPRVWGALVNTLIVVVGGVGIELVLGLALALLLVDDLRGKRVVIPLLILPVMITPIVVAFTWRMLWDAQYGAINELLAMLLGRPVLVVWLGSRVTALFAILVTEVWQWTPFMFLILLAGLAGISQELYEAAAIDGAGWWRRFRDITLPSLSRVIAVAVLFRALEAFKVFDFVFLLTQGGPGTATETISFYVYQLGFQFFRMGYAAAISYLVLIGLTVFATLYVARFLREERVR